jgi:hypothetical protein
VQSQKWAELTVGSESKARQHERRVLLQCRRNTLGRLQWTATQHCLAHAQGCASQYTTAQPLTPPHFCLLAKQVAREPLQGGLQLSLHELLRGLACSTGFSTVSHGTAAHPFLLSFQAPRYAGNYGRALFPGSAAAWPRKCAVHLTSNQAVQQTALLYDLLKGCWRCTKRAESPAPAASQAAGVWMRAASIWWTVNLNTLLRVPHLRPPRRRGCGCGRPPSGGTPGSASRRRCPGGRRRP